MLDGDDALLIVEKPVFQYLNPTHFTRMGFKTEIVINSNLTDVVFCRSKYLPTEPPRMAREPQRVLSHMSTSLKNYPSHMVRRYIAGVALCNLSDNIGVPIIQPLCVRLSGISQKPILDWDYEPVYGKNQPVPITDEVRISYYEAWGIPPALQVAYEEDPLPLLSPDDLLRTFYALPTEPVDYVSSRI